MGPMVIMLIGFVVIRQFYLYILTRYISNTPQLVGFGYPVGWMDGDLRNRNSVFYSPMEK